MLFKIITSNLIFCPSNGAITLIRTMSRKHVSHCVKSVRIWSFSGPHFSTFGLNTERSGVSLPIQSKCMKIRVRKTPNTETFHAVSVYNWSVNHHFNSMRDYRIL